MKCESVQAGVSSGEYSLKEQPDFLAIELNREQLGLRHIVFRSGKLLLNKGPLPPT
jgi:hypothetical protein